MANFSQDQVRQFYVVNNQGISPLQLTNSPGTAVVKNNTEDVWLEYVTPNGDHGNVAVVRTDLIPIKNVVRALQSTAKVRPLKRVAIDFNPDVNTSNPVVGQEYILRFTFYNLGMGGPENQYIKLGGAYRVKPSDTAATVATALANLATLNLSREATPYVTVTALGNQIIVEEVEQPWVLGKKQAAQVNFEIHTVPVDYLGVSYPWGVTTDTTATNTNVIRNGKTTADMEYFYIGERADQFRGMGYPDNFDTKYVANPNDEFDFIDIEYFYAGDAEDIQRSKKYLTLAISKSGAYNLASVVADLTAAGINVV